MAIQRCLLEMGMGVDLHGKDATKAARRAVDDAIRHSSVSFPRVMGASAGAMYVDVTIGVPYPETVDGDAVLEALPYGTKTIKVVAGGLEVPGGGDDSTLIANASVIVSLDV